MAKSFWANFQYFYGKDNYNKIQFKVILKVK